MGTMVSVLNERSGALLPYEPLMGGRKLHLDALSPRGCLVRMIQNLLFFLYG